MSVNHSFDIDLATKFGIEEAILIHHFQYWIRHNRKLDRHFYEGRYWTYQSREEIAAHFPYWTEAKIRRYTDSLLKNGILIKGNFNKTPFDRTIWYAFKDEEIFLNVVFSKTNYVGRKCQMDLNESPNPKDQLATPIPDTIPDTKTYEEHPPTPPEGGKHPKGAAVKPALESFGSHIKLKKEDYENFCTDYGKTNVDQLFEEINDWISSGRGKAYKDYAAGIRTWIRRREWSKSENQEPGFIQPTVPKEFDGGKSARVAENERWFAGFILKEENQKYKGEAWKGESKIDWLNGEYVDFLELQEGKIYYDQDPLVFQSCIQSAIMKLTH